MQNEVRSQRLTAFGQLLANPAIAPWVKVPVYVREFVRSLELDPDEFINDPNTAQIYAAMIGMAGGVMQGQQPQQTMGMGEVGGIPAPAMPGQEQFAGNAPMPEEIA